MTRPTAAAFTPFAIVLLAALLAVLPLALGGPSCGHDLSFHLLNWMDAAHQWHSGTLRPWWCSPAAWNTGEPRFLFYPPLSWILGGLLTLAFGAVHAPLLYTLLALTACGIAMRRFLLAYCSPPLALLGACLYLAHPYLLFTATERTAYAELLAAAWLPWLLLEALRPASNGDTAAISARGLAIPVALLWLTNTPSAILATYALAVVLAIRLTLALRKRQPFVKPLLLPATLGCLWGLALAALYLVPAIVQHSAVEVGQAFTTGMRPEDGTLFAHTGEPFHDQVLHQASWLAVILLVVAAGAAASYWTQTHRVRRLHGMRELTLRETRRPAPATLFPTLLILTALTAFLLTPASLFLWHHLPELRFLQFPWRTLMLQGVVTVTLLALAIRTPLRMRVAVPLALASATALGFAAHHSYAQTCDDEDAPRSLLAQYNSGDGFEPYDEYTPRDADNDLLHQGEPPAWTAAAPGAPPTAAAAAHARIVPATAEGTLSIYAAPGTGDRFLIVRQRSFRNWRITLDGASVQPAGERDDDLTDIALPDTRPHIVTLRYRWSADETAGLLLSICALLLLPARRLITAGRLRSSNPADAPTH